MPIICPASLRTGDTIAIVPTARAISQDDLNAGIALAGSWGLKVKLGSGVGRTHFQQAGLATERAADLQNALNDPAVRAIWCARGGYGTAQLLEHLDLSVLRNDPKWIVGFSDITVLHNALHNLGIATLHAQMPFHIGSKSEASRDTLRNALFGKPTAVDLQLLAAVADKEPDDQQPTTGNRPGTCEGIVVGGNLSLLYALRGTPYDIDPRGKILFLEDLDELLYHVDRMVLNLKLAGWFKELAGLVIGGMTDMRDKNPLDPFGQTAEQIILNAVLGTNYPVCFGFPAGHVDDNRALVLGQKAQLSVTENSATLSFEYPMLA